MLEEGDVAGDVILGGWGRVDVDLEQCVSRREKRRFVGPSIDRLMEDRVACLALGEEEFDTPTGVGMGDGVVITFLVVAHGVEAFGW